MLFRFHGFFKDSEFTEFSHCCIDVNNLKYNIINHLLQLKQFQFNIHSFVSVDNRNNLPSNEDNCFKTKNSLLNIKDIYIYISTCS